ncbi:MAG: hypothetical protein KC619_26565 [Myxococcales bacterium]|nr:hypothetical protein [Myxococcales bacterium]
MTRTIFASVVGLASLCHGTALAQELSASGLLGESPYGVYAQVAESNSNARLFYRLDADSFVHRTEISLPLDATSREAAFVRDENLATGFRGYTFFGGRFVGPATVPASTTGGSAPPGGTTTGGRNGTFAELGGEASFSYDRVELRDMSDLTVQADARDSYHFEIGGRLFVWEQVHPNWTWFAAPRLGFRLQRAITSAQAQLCSPVAMNPMLAERCSTVRFLESAESDTGDVPYFYARLGGGVTFDLGAHRLGLYGEVASTDLFTDATIVPRLMLFFTPNIAGALGLLFGVGVQTQFVTETGTSTTTPYLVVGGQAPWGGR